MVRVQKLTLFLPRDAICLSAVFAVSQCLSVCLSVTFVYCIQVVEDIIKLLFRPGSHIILVFFTPSADTQFQGNPVSLGENYTGVRKICDFRLKSMLIS